MDLSTGPLEGSARIQERPFGQSSEEPKRRPARRPKGQAEPMEVGDQADEQDKHQVDDIA